MQKHTATRVAGPLSLAAMLLGGLTTNCEDCGDVDVTARSRPRTPAPGTTEQIPGCESARRFRAFDTLQRPEQCDGTSMNGLELQPFPLHLGRCPDDGAEYTAAEQFQVYWTICNTADRPPTTVLPYQLTISPVQGGTEAQPMRALDFVQPTLPDCDCTTEIVIFNSATDPDPQRRLSPGSYRFRLTAPYSSLAYEQVQVTP